MSRGVAIWSCALMLPVLAAGAAERRVEVADDAGLRRAVREARPGGRVVVAAGKYQPGVDSAGLRGTPDAPIVIEGADPTDKPVFAGGRLGLHFTDCAHLTIRNIAVRGQSGNGINIDDGGTFDTPAHHVT